jgi:hypothetical protein
LEAFLPFVDLSAKSYDSENEYDTVILDSYNLYKKQDPSSINLASRMIREFVWKIRGYNGTLLYERGIFGDCMGLFMHFFFGKDLSFSCFSDL